MILYRILVTSGERDGLWWGPDRRGYVRHAADAGVYTQAEADAICLRSRCSQAVPVDAVSALADLRAALRDAHERCASLERELADARAQARTEVAA